jgi:acyl carrier protein
VTAEEIRELLLEELGNIAPEADLSTFDENANLREELDIDSMDLLNWIAAIHARLGVNVPERDYAKLSTLKAATEYMITALKLVQR